MFRTGSVVTVGSLFTGIGGIDLGLEWAGHKVLWQVESNTYCRRVLASHWTQVPCYEDITTLTGAELTPVDLICGGFPCQAASYAGEQKGAEDERWLWPHFARLVGVLRPRYALLENVPGLLTVSGGHLFGSVIGDLAAIGYDCQWDVLSAAQFGAQHLRNRLWILGERQDVVADAWSQRLEGVSPVGTTTPSTGRAGGESRERQKSAMAHTDQQRCVRERQPEHQGEPRPRWREPDGRLPVRRFFDATIRCDWHPEPNVGRVAHGIPERVDRLRSLGNSVVPQVTEWIGHRLITYQKECDAAAREGRSKPA